MKRECLNINQTVIALMVVTFLDVTVLHSESENSWPNADIFAAPSDRYGVETFVQWENGHVTKSGLTKDLEAMREQGIVRQMIYFVGHGETGPVSPLLSETWLDHWRYTISEAHRLGIKTATHICPGWSEAGGPWIKPENSMKRIIWSQVLTEGGRLVDCDLPPLPATLNWSKEIAVLAWPVRHPSSRMQGCTIQYNGKDAPTDLLFDGNPETGIRMDSSPKWRLDLKFPQKYAFDRVHLFIRWDPVGFPAPLPKNKIIIHVLANGIEVTEFSLERKLFSDAVDIPLPDLVKAAHVSIEGEELVTEPVQPWHAWNHAHIVEAELLDTTEIPQWECELKNLPSQVASILIHGGSSQPEWRTGDSHPISSQQIIDLSKQTTDGHLRWNAPDGNWRVVRFGYTTTGAVPGSAQATKEGVGLEFDKMSVAAADLHFHSYIEPLWTAIPENDRSTFDAVESDSWEAGYQNWTDDFPEEFQKRLHYSIIPYLPVFAGEVAGSREETERFLNDLRETISNLITERYYGRNAELLHQKHLRYEAEIADADCDLLNPFAIARVIDLPMDEFWTNYKADGRPPRSTLVPEAAFVAGKSVVGVEGFTSTKVGWEQTPGDYGYLADYAMLWGYNCLNLHSYVHQPEDKGPGWTLANFGSPFNRLNTWWPMIGDWLTQIRRTQYLSQTSTPVYDILVYYGDTVPHPGRPWSPEIPGLPPGCRPLRIDQVTLKQLTVQKDGSLTLHGDDRYLALLVPHNRLHADTVEAIAKLLKNGASIAANSFGHAPGWAQHEEQDRRIAKITAELWSKTPSQPKLYSYSADGIQKLFSENHWLPPFTSTNDEKLTPLFTQHRRTAQTDLFTLFNPNEKAVIYHCTLTDATTRSPEIWDALTGRHWLIPSTHRENDQLRFDLQIESRHTLHLILPLTSTPNPSLPPPITPPTKTFPIATPFTVTFKNLPQTPPQVFVTLDSWTNQANPQIRTYSGIATYKTEFTLPANFPVENATEINLGSVGKVARVTLNGHLLGTLWKAPWRLAATGFLKPGSNSLSVDVANTWLNHLLADMSKPPETRSTFTSWSLQSWIDSKITPEPSGLLGPVTLEETASP